MIDVIIPVYNLENYIKECLDSFVCQYDGTFKIIIIDDGSSDSSGCICKEYQQKHTFIEYHHKKNGGLSSARNYGLMFSKSDYVFFFDGDDYIDENAFIKIKKTIVESSPDIIFIEDDRFLDGDSKFTYIDSKISKKVLLSNDKERILKHLLRLRRMRVAAWSMIFKKKSFSDLTFEEGMALEDVDWSIKMLTEANSFDIIKGPIYHYRVRGDSLSHSCINSWKIESLLTVINKRCSRDKTLPYQWFINGHLACFYVQILYLTSKDKVLLKQYFPIFKQYKWLLKYGKNSVCLFSKIIAYLFGLKTLIALFRISRKK